MDRTRRETLGLVGTTATVLCSGCLAPGDDGGDGGGGSGGDSEDGSSGGDSGGTGDGDDGTTTNESTPPETDTDDGTEPPTDTPDGLPEGLDRVDSPPYDIEPIECEINEEGEGDRDPLYLCASMPAEPSLSFEQVSARGGLLTDEGLTTASGHGTEDQLYATLLTDESDLDRIETDSGDAAALISETSFETHAILVVQTGWGSGSIIPHLKRIEETNTGIHAFGCYTQPCVWTEDITVRTAVARFERPETLDSGVVSLTVEPTTRYNVATGEGVVSIPSDG